MTKTNYSNPLIDRYASHEMSYIFSYENRTKIWRQLWVELAKAQKKLGIDITEKQINELLEYQNKIDYDVVAEEEKKTRHEVVSHIRAYMHQCETAKKIIHLGATSADIMDNGDLIQMKSALELVKRRLINVIKLLRDFVDQYKSYPTLGYTHLQKAQPTTVGKRAALWLQDLMIDYSNLIFHQKTVKFKGMKGATGTQGSYLKLFDGDSKKVEELDRMLCEAFGFESKFTIASQTYTRKVDYSIMSVLSGLGQSCHKFSTDIRLLQSFEEIEEPFETTQVGSSAMPYKRNPIRSERLSSLSRLLISSTEAAAYNHSVQWLERSLDDSANRRIYIPEAFLIADASLIIYRNIISRLNVNKKVIEEHLEHELPFLLTEDIIIENVKRGADRQAVHEALREISMELKKKGSYTLNNYISLLEQNENIILSVDEIKRMIDPDFYTGRSVEQINEFLSDVDSILSKERELIENENIELKV